MKTLVICFSYHHKNTEKIASTIASTLNAEMKTPQEIDPNDISNYDLVGFGSGIYFGKLHKVFLDLADKLPQVTNKKAFIFSTSGRKDNMAKFHKQLKEKLQSTGVQLLLPLQREDGSWGPGGTTCLKEPSVATSFALLFLKRSNLARDLTKRLNNE